MRLRLVSALAVIGLLALSITSESATAPRIVPDSLIQKAWTQGEINVLARLNVPWTPEPQMPTPAHVANQRLAIRALASGVTGGLRGFGHRVKREYETLPLIALTVDAHALTALEALRGIVVSVVEDEWLQLHHAESVPLVYQAGPPWPEGLDGAGTVVAVLDTGVSKTHPFLATKVVAEACFSTTISGSLTNLCPGGVDSTAPGSGVNCTGADGCEHGTHVAGTIAGGTAGGAGSGVAPGAKLWAIQVFSRAAPALCPGGVACAVALTSDVIAGLEHVFLNRHMTPLGGRPVAAVNLSLGGGLFSSACDGAPEKPAIDNLRAAGIATVVASGNDDARNAISRPACISSAIAVGSTGDGSLGAPVDVVSSFSNIGAFPTLLLAPGEWIRSSVPGGGFADSRGTSMAAPHVAGAFAVLRQTFPTESVTSLFELLRDTGLGVRDTRTGGLHTKPRIRLGEALSVVGVVRFRASAFSAEEGDGTATITVERTEAAGPATVRFATSNGTALAGTHYTATSGTLTFGAGETSKTFAVAILDNAVLNADRTVNLTLASPTGVLLGSPATAVLTIEDDDTPGTIAFSDDSYTVSENGSAVTITVGRSGTNLTGGVTAPFSTANGSAIAGTDYGARSGTLTFAAGETSKTFTVPIINDTLVEGSKTFQVRLGPPGGGAALGSPATATVTILEEETAGTVQLSSAAYSVNESAGSALITVTRTGTSLASGVRVAYAASSGTATAGSDFGAAAGTLTFAAGVTSMTFRVPVVNDSAVEPAETVNLTLSVPIGSPAVLGAPSAAVLTIADNDAPVIQFAAVGQAVAEGGTASVVVTRASGLAIGASASYEVLGGSATGGGVDYTLASGTVAFAPGVTSARISIPTVNDTLAEGSETIVLRLSDPSPQATLGPRTQTTITIADNDSGGTIAFRAAALGVAENVPGGALTIPVSRAGTGLASNVTVDYAVTGGTATGGADYTLASGTLTFAAGQTAHTLSLALVDDLLPEGNETVVVTLTNPSSGATLGPLATTTVTILDDEQAVGFSLPAYAVTEGVPSIAIPIVRAGPVPAGVAVTCQTVDGGTAVPGLDYRPVPPTTLVFAAGSRTVHCIVPLLNDTLVDGARTVHLALSVPPGSPALLTPQSTAVLTLNDNDQGGALRFAVATATVAEGATATVTVTRLGTNLASNVTVDYAVTGGTATGGGTDYTLASGTLAFAAGVTSRSFTVPTVNDTLVEGAETVTLALANPTGGATLATPAAFTLSIADNDRGGTIAFATSAYTVVEGNAVVVTVNRAGTNLASDVTVDYAVAGGSAAHGADFTLPAGTLAFAAGETSKTITVPTTADGVTEGNETLVIALGNVTGGGVLGVLKTTTVTIRDAAQVRFSNDVVLCDLFACYAFTARLTTSGGHAWLSFTGEPSAYQPVPELRLTNPVVQAVEFGITMPFATSFAIAPSRRYAIALRASGGNPLLVLLDEGPLSLPQEGPDTAASVTATPGVPATAPPGIRFEPLRQP